MKTFELRVKRTQYGVVKVNAPDRATAIEYMSEHYNYDGDYGEFNDCEYDAEYDLEAHGFISQDGSPAFTGINEIAFDDEVAYVVDTEWLTENGYELVVRKKVAA